MEDNAQHIEQAIRIAELIGKARDGEELSPAEAILLKEWMNEAGHELTYQQLLDRNQLLTELQRMERWNDRDRISALLSAAANLPATHRTDPVPQPENPTPFIPQHREPLRRIAWFRYAAAVIALLAIGAYLWNNENKKNATDGLPQQAYVKNDVSPGGDKAILTLADGRKIALDSAAQGYLAKQEGTNISKAANGQIIYSADAPSHTIAYNTMSTPRGGQYRLTLPDGSLVWLNAASSITFPTSFSGNLREVTISGEAYFEVAKKPGSPFRVAVKRSSDLGGDMQVQVLGTHFNINAYDDEIDIKTTLLEGSVSINNRLTLQPGQQSQFNKEGALLQSTADISQVIAWKEGMFNFSSSDIGTVMRQIEKWYDIDVRYKGAKTTDRFTGKIKRSVNLSELLKILEYSKVHFQLEDRTLTVLP